MLYWLTDKIITAIGPGIMTLLFYYFTNKNAAIQFAGAPFLLGAVLLIISTFLAKKSLRSSGKQLPLVK